MIRKASVEDIPVLVEMGRKWHGESHWPLLADYIEADLTASLKTIIETQILLVSGEPITGAICILVSPIYFNLSARIGQEFFWFSNDPREGLKLLKAAETMAVAAGCACLLLGTQNNDDRISKIYRRLGYAPFNGNFVKGL